MTLLRGASFVQVFPEAAGRAQASAAVWNLVKSQGGSLPPLTKEAMRPLFSTHVMPMD